MANQKLDQTTPCYDAVGMYQSPISFNPEKFPAYPGFRANSIGNGTIIVPGFPDEETLFSVHYSKVGTPEQNISFYISVPGPLFMTFGMNNYKFYLTSFHFHSPSEHTFPTPTDDGVLDMEMHTVWRNTPDVNNTSVPALVVSVPIKVSATPNSEFDFALSGVLTNTLTDGANIYIDNSLFSSVFYAPGTISNFQPSIIYPGSFTTSPYQEGVTFIVFNSYEVQPATISSTTLSLFQNIKFSNGQGIGKPRPVQTQAFNRPIIVWTPN